MAISIAALAARSYRSASYLFLPPSLLLLSLFFLWFLLLSFLSSWRSATRPVFSALPAAERQMSRILCAASISPIGHWVSSSQISFCLPLSNHPIAPCLENACGRSPRPPIVSQPMVSRKGYSTAGGKLGPEQRNRVRLWHRRRAVGYEDKPGTAGRSFTGLKI